MSANDPKRTFAFTPLTRHSLGRASNVGYQQKQKAPVSISRKPRSVGPMEVFLPSSSFGSSSYRLLLSPLAVQILAIDRRTISFEIARIASAGRLTPEGP